MAGLILIVKINDYSLLLPILNDGLQVCFITYFNYRFYI